MPYELKNGYRVWYDDKPKPLTKEQVQALAKTLKARAEQEGQPWDESRTRELEARRHERLVREEYESLTPEERDEFEATHGKVAVVRRLAEAARREADQTWLRADQERQHEALIAWRKSSSNPDSDAAGQARKIKEFHQQGVEQAQARLEARAKRELEAEIHDDEVRRLLAGLDEEERNIFRRLLDEQPDQLSRLRQFKAERRNPIAEIDDPATLYRLAMARPKKEKYLPPTSQVEQIDDPRTLLAMSFRDAEEKRRNKRGRK